MQLERIMNIKGVITLLSGLHIGAGKDAIEIGGLDQPIIKHPISGAPYIPGSSLKGKMRSLLEIYFFAKQNADTRAHISAGKPCACGKASCPACAIFGSHGSPRDMEENLGPTRVIVRDALLTPKFQEIFERGELPMEVKYENIIDRVRGVAEHPRPLERVPAGVQFNFSIAFKVFAGDDTLVDYVFKGLRLVELDALGGCGSRGSGQVRFDDLTCDDETIDLNAYALS